jgi:hypothetical protein
MLAIGQVIGAAVGLGTHTIESTAYVPLTPVGSS